MLRVVVDSTNIVSIGYDGRKRHLEVEFRESGAVYLYFEVPAEIHREFMAAESKGTYLNQVLNPEGLHTESYQKEICNFHERAPFAVLELVALFI